MNIGIIADNSKKKLLEDFCIAYRAILSRHKLYATQATGRVMEMATNLPVYKMLAGSIGGDQQMGLFIEQSGIDLVLVFKEASLTPEQDKDIFDIFQLCDRYNVPLATNLATAEMLIKSLDRGELDWRENYRNNDI